MKSHGGWSPHLQTRCFSEFFSQEYYEARERLMIDRAKFALRVKLLKLRGPKNHKDLILQWVRISACQRV